jgi:hypothetical protein
MCIINVSFRHVKYSFLQAVYVVVTYRQAYGVVIVAHDKNGTKLKPASICNVCAVEQIHNTLV